MSKGFTRDKLKKQDFLVLRKSTDNSVTQVIAPNGLQVGLTDDKFQASLIAKGGITGSLTQLVDGTPYLLAGTGISLVTGSSGAVTISGHADVVRATLILTQAYSTAQDIVVSNSGLSATDVSATNSTVSVYLNGDLLLTGSSSEISDGTKDYKIIPSSLSLIHI